jgi:hypothetical protein
MDFSRGTNHRGAEDTEEETTEKSEMQVFRAVAPTAEVESPKFLAGLR